MKWFFNIYNVPNPVLKIAALCFLNLFLIYLSLWIIKFHILNIYVCVDVCEDNSDLGPSISILPLVFTTILPTFCLLRHIFLQAKVFNLQYFNPIAGIRFVIKKVKFGFGVLKQWNNFFTSKLNFFLVNLGFICIHYLLIFVWRYRVIY